MMTIENAEQMGSQLTLEVTRKSIELSGTVARGTWNELKAVVAHAVQQARSSQPEKLGGRVPPRQLEEWTRGQRDAVNLTDPRIARRVERELTRSGVTFSVTREGSSRRIHIGAGNAAQLDQAMKRAESVVARSIQKTAARSELRGKVRGALRERLSSIKLPAAPSKSPGRQRGRR